MLEMSFFSFLYNVLVFFLALGSLSLDCVVKVSLSNNNILDSTEFKASVI